MTRYLFLLDTTRCHMSGRAYFGLVYDSLAQADGLLRDQRSALLASYAYIHTRTSGVSPPVSINIHFIQKTPPASHVAALTLLLHFIPRTGRNI